MSTVAEFKAAAERLSAADRWELYRWLGESEGVQRLRHEELRREIALGLERADSGDLAALDIPAAKREVRRLLAARSK